MSGEGATTTSLTGVPIEISDPTDPRLTDYVSLTDVVLRRRRKQTEAVVEEPSASDAAAQ